MSNDSTKNPTDRLYIITANGTYMGAFAARDEDAAIDAYARDAGYRDFADLLDRVPGATRDEVDVESTGDIVAAWRERIWGDSPEGAEYLVEHDGMAYMVTVGTGEGVFAYLVGDVAAWLAEDAREEHPDDSRPYQRFCDSGTPESSEALAIAVWRETEFALCDGTCAEIIDRDNLPAAAVTDDELAADLAKQLRIDRERLTLSRDVDAHGCDYWLANVDLAEGDRVEGGERGTQDHDTGTVLEVDGARVYVGWEGGAARTWTPIKGLLLDGIEPEEEIITDHGVVTVRVDLR